MTITLSNAGKRFNRDWIFRNINYQFQQGKSYAIIGPNGSGKSTLLQLLAGSMNLSEGSISYELSDLSNQQSEKESLTSNLKPQTSNSQHPTSENIYKYISIVAPYLEVIEEMTANEFLLFHQTFKPFISSLSISQIIEIIGLGNAANKQIRFYSSGIKQRIKLAQAIFSDEPVLLLDEPCTNFDEVGYRLYHQMINMYCSNKLIIVSSNDKNEYDFCEEILSMMDYK